MANFDSAWFLYGALLLLLATSFVVRIDYARIGLAAAALVALPLTLFRGSDLGYSLLVLAILVVNIGILTRLWLRGTKVSFSAEEEALRREHFAGLSAAAGTNHSRALLARSTVPVAWAPSSTVASPISAPSDNFPISTPSRRIAANPGIAGALHEGFARALRGKLASANTRIAER